MAAHYKLRRCSARLRIKKMGMSNFDKDRFKFSLSVRLTMTAEDICLLVRDLFEESRSSHYLEYPNAKLPATEGVGRVFPGEKPGTTGMCAGFFNLGWSTGAYEKALPGGIDCFCESTRDLFIRFFECEDEAKLKEIQRRGWGMIPPSTQETYVRFGLARFAFPKCCYDERHPDFVQLVREVRAAQPPPPRPQPPVASPMNSEDSDCVSSAA
jgi:hypothetical protein